MVTWFKALTSSIGVRKHTLPLYENEKGGERSGEEVSGEKEDCICAREITVLGAAPRGHAESRTRNLEMDPEGYLRILLSTGEASKATTEGYFLERQSHVSERRTSPGVSSES